MLARLPAPARVLAVLSVLALVGAACGGSAVADVSLETPTTMAGSGGTDLEATLADSGADLGTLFEAMDLSGFDLADAESVTFFAPNDTAFTALDADALADYMAEPDRLADLLAGHVVDGVLTSEDLTEPMVTETGTLLVFEQQDGVLTVNDIEIVRSDLEIANGVVHVIDGILLDE